MTAVAQPIEQMRWELASRLTQGAKGPEDVLQHTFKGIILGLEQYRGIEVTPCAQQRVWRDVSKERLQLLRADYTRLIAEKVLGKFSGDLVEGMLNQHKVTGAVFFDYDKELLKIRQQEKRSEVVDALMQRSSGFAKDWVPEILAAIMRAPTEQKQAPSISKRAEVPLKANIEKTESLIRRLKALTSSKGGGKRRRTVRQSRQNQLALAEKRLARLHKVSEPSATADSVYQIKHPTHVGTRLPPDLTPKQRLQFLPILCRVSDSAIREFTKLMNQPFSKAEVLFGDKDFSPVAKNQQLFWDADQLNGRQLMRTAHYFWNGRLVAIHADTKQEAQKVASKQNEKGWTVEPIGIGFSKEELRTYFLPDWMNKHCRLAFYPARTLGTERHVTDKPLTLDGFEFSDLTPVLKVTRNGGGGVFYHKFTKLPPLDLQTKGSESIQLTVGYARGHWKLSSQYTFAR